MGEAFLMGGGGGATVQRITLTDATSNTFTLTNPKRNNCLVFGRIYSSHSHYNDWDGILSSWYTRDHTLYGTKYSVLHTSDSTTSDRHTFNTEQAMTITRNASSVTITLDANYSFTYRSTTTNKVTNTIDIYVVDYD